MPVAVLSGVCYSIVIASVDHMFSKYSSHLEDGDLNSDKQKKQRHSSTLSNQISIFSRLFLPQASLPYQEKRMVVNRKPVRGQQITVCGRVINLPKDRMEIYKCTPPRNYSV